MNTIQNNKQQPLQIQTMFQRDNWLMKVWSDFFLAISSRPRMLIETLIRTNLGERYFNLSSCLFMALVLAAYPIWKKTGLHYVGLFDDDRGEFSMADFIAHYFTWYVYLAVYLYCTFQRYDEVRRLPGVFDFARYSLSNGYIHPFFQSLKINGRPYSRRTIEIWLEPGLFFIGGLMLWFLGQGIGPVLTFCSVIYSLSYAAAYRQGDDKVKNWIDEAIVREEFTKIMIEGKEAEETRGVTFMGRRPENLDIRRQMVDAIVGKPETFTISQSSVTKTRSKRAKAVLREDV